MNIFKRFRAMLRLKEAVRQADKAHKKTGERYYVMPNGNTGKLIIMDRFNFRKMKQKGYVSQNAIIQNLIFECFYCTPYRNGDGMLPKSVIDLKRKQYMSWIILLEKNKGNGKVRKH